MRNGNLPARLPLATLAAALLCSPAISRAQPAQPAAAKPAMTAVDSAPGLAVGQKAPDATLTDAEGNKVELKDLVAKGPLVVVFYRGGWCPFCDKHLAAWGAQLDAMKAMGATIIAVSPEKHEQLKGTAEKAGVAYALYSDANLDAARAFKLAFDLDDATRTKYKGYGIDLSTHNASGAWTLPHPATYVIDREGMIRYAHADKDYTRRADPKDAMEVLKTLGGK